MSTNAFMLKAMIVFAALVVIKNIYNVYRRHYFKSDEFAKLNRDTDHIAEQYDYIVELSSDIKKNFYADFTPRVIENEIVRGSEKRSYICSKYFIHKLEGAKHATIKESCGFTNSVGIRKRLEDLLQQLKKLEKEYDKFKADCEDAFKKVDKSVPMLIRIFSKHRVLLLLGMETATLELTDIVPKYTFFNNENYKKIDVEFDSKFVHELLT